MKTVIIIVIAVIAVAAGIVFLTGQDSSNQPTGSDTGQSRNQNTPQESSANETYTVEQVAAHNTARDCWTIINNTVYNITNHVREHPGGNEILRACGTDATKLFETRTTEDGEVIGSGNGHSDSARGILSQYKIGTVAN